MRNESGRLSWVNVRRGSALGNQNKLITKGSPMNHRSRLALVAFSAFALCAQAAAAQPQGLLPSVGASVQFGGAAQSSRFQAQLSFRGLQTSVLTADGLHPRQISTLTFERSAADGSSLQVFGAPVLLWNTPAQSRFALQQNGQGRAESGSWFSRNWWVLGLGAIAAGVAVAAGGGSGGTSETQTNSTNTNCTVGSGNVGPAESPGVPTNMPCPST